MTTIIVNADDFGMSPEINEAIMESFRNKYISTTTMMANMPGFEDAVELYHKEKLNNCVGAHLNLSEGKPLTEKIHQFKKFSNTEREMFKSYKGHLLTSNEKSVVYHELNTQIKKLLKHGIKPTHLDTHHHTHHLWDIGKVIIELAKNHNIPAIRLCFNYGKIISYKTKMYSIVYNYRLRKNYLAKTRVFCEIKSVDKSLWEINNPIEIMVHPAFDSEKHIVNYKGGDSLKNLIDFHLPQVEKKTYAEIIIKK